MEEENADKVTVVLAAAEGLVDMLQPEPVGAGCVPVAAGEAGTVPAARGPAVVPVWIRGSWTGPVIQGEPGSLAAAGPD